MRPPQARDRQHHVRNWVSKSFELRNAEDKTTTMAAAPLSCTVWFFLLAVFFSFLQEAVKKTPHTPRATSWS